MATKLCSVYGLYSTKDGLIRYIGQTEHPPRRRLIQHLCEAKGNRGDRHCHRWIRKTLREGYQVRVRLVESECALDKAEIRWINIYRSKYPELMTNIANGGECGTAGIKRSEKTKSKMRKPKSETHRAHMRKPKSAATKKRMSLAQVGNQKSAGEANRHAKLTEQDVIDIKGRLKAGEGPTAIAAIYGVQKAAISKINVRRNWRSKRPERVKVQPSSILRTLSPSTERTI